MRKPAGTASPRRQDCRAAAARCIAAVLSGQSLTPALAAAEPAVEPRDRGLLKELCYGSLRWYPQLNALCQTLLSQPMKARDADINAVLIVGAYQLLHMGMPPHAAVSSAVDAVRALDKAWARGLVNAVLRRLQREAGPLQVGLPDSARHAHPEWLWERLCQDWGEAAAISIAAANNSRPPMTLRVNIREHSRDRYLEILRAAGLESHPCANAPEGVQLVQPIAVEQLPGFGQGWVSVQDEAAQRVASLLAGMAPGMRVLDACSAPGGKAAHLLEQYPGIELTAMDVDAARLQKVAGTLDRLGLKAQLVCGDGCDPASWWDGVGYDAILIDAPCSGSGVIRRHPDIKLLRKASDIAVLAKRQLDLLQQLWPLLKPGGTLIYTTCSVLSEENSAVAAAFSEWVGAEARASHPVAADAMPTAAGLQLLPTIDGPDGFFYARWHRTGS